MGVKEITSAEVLERLQQGEDLQLIDVREVEEYQQGHIPGVKLIPMGQVAERKREIDTERETVVVCRSGHRSAMVCQYLQEAGFGNVKNLLGGMLDWKGEVE